MRAWHLFAAGAAAFVAAATAATVSPRLVAAAFVGALCIAWCAFTLAFRITLPTLNPTAMSCQTTGRGRRRLVAAGRSLGRAVRVAGLVTAGLAFAAVAIAGTLLESGIYKLPLPTHAATGSTPRNAAPQHAASARALDRQTPLVPLGLPGERHAFSGLLAPGAPVRLRDLTTGAPGGTIADASGAFVFRRGVVGHLYELSVPGRRARLRLLYRSPIDLR